MASNCTRMITVDSLIFADNVRTPECMQIPAMVASIKRHGFKNNHPLVVSEKPDGKYLVLIGNRRGLGLEWLRDNEADEYRRALSGGKLPAVIYKGLTREEEVELRIDHSSDEDRVSLDEWSQFLAIQQLVQVGIDTQERIAIKLGYFIAKGKNKGQPNRSHVQTRVNLARLPRFVHAEMEKLCREGKEATPMRWADVAKLSKEYNAEFAEYPDSDGPDFQAAWKAVLTPPEVSEPSESTSDPKELSAADAVKRAQAAQSQGLTHALLAVTRQSSCSLAEIDAAIVEGESAIVTLAQIAGFLGEKDYRELLDTSAAHAAEKSTDCVADQETVDVG